MNLHGASDEAAYLRHIEDWWARRIAALSAEDGWLNLVGRWEISQSVTTIGAAPSNDIVLPLGQDHIGSIEIAGDRALFRSVGGASALTLILDKRRPPRFTVDALLLEITTMNGRHALRARDRFSPKRASPPMLEYFPVDPRWRIMARWKLLDEPLVMTVDTMIGEPTEVVVTRTVRFKVAEGTFDILATHGSSESPQFVFRDGTSGSETYPASRFLFGEPQEDKEAIVLDFNKAINPPCAFTDFAVCPLPPQRNVLPFRIPAGERLPPAVSP